MKNPKKVTQLRSKARCLTTFVPLNNDISKLDFIFNNVSEYNVSEYKVITLRSYNRFIQQQEKHKMVRPLLDLKRESITIVCKDLKIPVYPDQSNKTVQHSRNRIRRQILPSIKYFINPQAENSLFKIAELLNKEQFFLYSVLRNTSASMPL